MCPPPLPDALHQSHHALIKAHAALREGRYGDAATSLAEVVAAWKRVLGEDHVDTLANEHLLGLVYYTLGRHAKAAILVEDVVVSRKRATIYLALKQYVDASTILERVVQARRELFGVNNVDTLSSMHSLAHAYQYLGRTAKAAS